MSKKEQAQQLILKKFGYKVAGAGLFELGRLGWNKLTNRNDDGSDLKMTIGIALDAYMLSEICDIYGVDLSETGFVQGVVNSGFATVESGQLIATQFLLDELKSVPSPLIKSLLKVTIPAAASAYMGLILVELLSMAYGE